MSVAWKHPLLVAIAAFAIACQTEDQASEQGSETQPAVDEAAVRETIATKDRAWSDAAVAGDIEALVAQYGPDAIVMPPGAPRAEGTDAIRALFTGWLQQAPATSATVTSDEITVAASGDYAHAAGSWTMSGTGPDGAEWSDAGKFLAVWQNLNGDWVIVRDIWNSDTPPPGTESEAAAAETAPSE